jgi:hypothetical protein
MPPAFFIAEVEVIGPEEFKLYASRVAEIAARYGGRYIVRLGDANGQVVDRVFRAADDYYQLQLFRAYNKRHDGETCTR